MLYYSCIYIYIYIHTIIVKSYWYNNIKKAYQYMANHVLK